MTTTSRVCMSLPAKKPGQRAIDVPNGVTSAPLPAATFSPGQGRACSPSVRVSKWVLATRRRQAMRLRTIGCLIAVLICRDARSQTNDRSASATAGIAGVVRDTLGRPLHLVAITALGRDTSVVTDDSGRFALAKLPPGPMSISVLRIGYRPITFEADLPADSTLMVAIRL